MKPLKNLSINTATITINVLRVDGHKMTKAVWNQIEFEKLEKWPPNSQILGHVLAPNAVLLWIKYGKLTRSNIVGWEQTMSDGSRVPAYKTIPQLFIAT